jgi:hypothetical protein
MAMGMAITNAAADTQARSLALELGALGFTVQPKVAAGP